MEKMQHLVGGVAGAGAAKIMAQEQENRMVSKLHAILDPFVLRRLKSEVVQELASKHVYVLFAYATLLLFLFPSFSPDTHKLAYTRV